MSERSWPNTNTLWAHVLVDELARCGLRTVVISPGSRSTPLVMAFSAHPDIDDLSMIDERSAAFFALGVARSTRRPTAIVCTSGTAAANYFPAICEAYADDVPLLALTADRPVDRLESGASQAMNQTRLYGEHVRWFADLGLPELDVRRLRALRSTMGLAWRHATTAQGGPVHLNVPFRKPLEPLSVEPDHRDAVPDELPEPIADVVSGRPDGGPFSPFETPRRLPTDETVDRFVDAILQAERPLVLAGADPRGRGYIGDLEHLADRLGVPVLAEPTSGLRFSGDQHASILGAGDLLLRADIYAHIGTPDLFIQLGKPPLHWAARRLTGQHPGIRRIAVTPSGRRSEPNHVSTTFVEADTQALLQLASRRVDDLDVAATQTGWLDLHREAARDASAALDASMESADDLHESRIWRELGRELPDGAALFVSNSMPIRHFDTFMSGRTARLEPSYNRGLNGIDGILSTGFGVAHARTVPRPDGARRSQTVIVTGDVAFKHDIGALVEARRLGVDATIVLCDNGGGAIFSALPIAEFEAEFEAHFLTPPGLVDADTLLGVPVVEPQTWGEFRTQIAESLAETGVQVIRIRLDRERDEALLKEHVDEAASATRGAVAGSAAEANSYTVGSSGSYTVGSSGATALPVVALHGFSGSSDDWARHGGAFGRHEVVAPDLPGHGRHPQLDVFDGAGLGDAVVWLERLLERQGARSVHLVGYSMGGRIALAYAVDNPERVASLSLIGANPGIREPDVRTERARWDEKMAVHLERDGLHSFVDEWMRHPVLCDQLELGHEHVNKARQTRLDNRSSGLAAAFRAFGTGRQLPMWDALAALSTPTLFLAGERDAKYVRIGEDVAEQMPDATCSVIGDAGHNPIFEQPERTLRAIRAHIERVEST